MSFAQARKWSALLGCSAIGQDSVCDDIAAMAVVKPLESQLFGAHVLEDECVDAGFARAPLSSLNGSTSCAICQVTLLTKDKGRYPFEGRPFALEA